MPHHRPSRARMVALPIAESTALELRPTVGETRAPMSAPVFAPQRVEARGLKKTYGLLPVLRGVDIDVPSHQILALLGANGAGKSTLLRCLAGISRPNGGSLKVLGAEWHPKRPERAALGRIGFVAHDPLVYLDLTPRQNLAFFARLYGVPEARVAPQLERFGIARVSDRATRTLSRGTLQRLALARALLHEPGLLMLDEPFTGLDDAGQDLLSQTLVESAAAGAAIVLVSHDLARVAAIAHRAVVLAGGRIVADHSPAPGATELSLLYRAATQGGAPLDSRPRSTEAAGPDRVEHRS